MPSLWQTVPAREENNKMWPCRAVQLWSIFWLKGEKVWFVTTLRWHHGCCTPRWLTVQTEPQSEGGRGGSKQERSWKKPSQVNFLLRKQSRKERRSNCLGTFYGIVLLLSPQLESFSSIFPIIFIPQGIWDLISCTFSWNLHFTCLLRLISGSH